MNSRAKKYFTNIKSEKKPVNSNITRSGDDKKDGKQNPSTQKGSATQDDTGGSNDSGKRADDN